MAASAAHITASTLPGPDKLSPSNVWSSIGSALSDQAAALSTVSSILSTQASFERRQEGWEFDLGLAQKDVGIGEQSIGIAEDKLEITKQERVITGIQATHALAILDFLQVKKFDTVEQLQWISGELSQRLKYFLTHATQFAKLAASQLAFERQELPPPYIQSDYWHLSSLGSATSATPQNRDGLTGPERLLEDIARLDERAFLTNTRKLQLTKSISLSHLAPAEFEMFRRTGSLRFSTTLEMFDRDFPGHYLRLIRRIRLNSCPAFQAVTPKVATSLVSTVPGDAE
jgi:Tc toxin complex TcA C-terminal TcB-binding domain